MRYCVNKNNERIDVFDAIEKPLEEYYCPICGSELVLRNGGIVVPHFAHKSLKDCDDFTHDMSEWHKEWQDIFPKENQEVVISLDIDEFTYHSDSMNYEFSDYKSYYEEHEEFERLCLTDKKDLKILHIQHRADVCIGKYVIEFQHSPISKKEFNKRNWFYTKAGYKLIWIFDFREEYELDKMYVYDGWDKGYDNGSKWGWDNPKKIFRNYVPQIDKNIIVLFQYETPEQILSEDDTDEDICYLEKIVWAIEDEDGYSNFKRFFGSFYPSNKTELKEYILKNKL